MHRHEGVGPDVRNRGEGRHACRPRAMRTRIGAYIMVAGIALAAGAARANNLTLTNLTIKPLDDTRAYAQFNIRWENSWRHTNINHDAAWVFFKIKPEGRTAWEHVTLETNDHVAGTGTAVEIVVPSDRVGCFIRRAGEGSGTVSVTNVKVAWNFASNSLAKTDRVRLQAFALELVYVAAGAFYVGSGGTETGSFTDGGWAGGTNPTIPFRITNEAALTITNIAGNLWGTSTAVQKTFGGAGILSNDFPKGYAAFYCMKYEITQGQYRDFLNSLTRVQQNTRTTIQNANNFALGGGAVSAPNRNGIRCPSVVPLSPGRVVFGCDGNANKVMNETNDAADRVCNYLLPADECAFADWAGLRPMTELEFEKACRGPLDPVTNEYAWGSIDLAATTGVLLNDGTGQEKATNGNCNYADCSPDGPYRAGIYATADSSRQAAGASYWGIMELSGNVWEYPVTLGHSVGRAFTGLHGDGRLDVSGNADVSQWPQADATGTGYRGGAWKIWMGSSDICISDRALAAYARNAREEFSGGRVARTAPAGVGP